VKAGIPANEAALDAEGQNVPLALVGWFTGCIMIWSALFSVGNFLYGRTGMALALLAAFVISGGILIRVVQRLWR
jgi:solute:Na+ symporter, SSS family